MNNNSDKCETYYDVVLVGGGLVGATLAIALAMHGMRVALVDREVPADTRQSGYDGRASAIALAGARVFQALDVWPYMEKDLSPIWDIRVANGHPLRGVSPFFLHYDHRSVGSDPFGWIIENSVIRRALFDTIATLDKLHYFSPATVIKTERHPSGAISWLKDGRQLKSAVIIAADGKCSPIRKAAGVSVSGFDYDQASIVCTVTHSRAHQGVAVELFLPGGPFAMLPMTADRSNVIWSDSRAQAKRIMSLDDEAFLVELKARFGQWLGNITVTGPRFSYPLSLQHAQHYVDHRLALVGDAAHVIHPIAGQGLNLGLRDVAALAEILVDAYRLGLDIGSVSILQRYEKWRRFDAITLALVTDGLLRLFSNDSGTLRLARNLGLGIVQHLPPVKRLLMRHAMGTLGKMPRLALAQRL